MIVVHHLNNSRSQRVLWLLEELGVPYVVQRYDRDPVSMLAPEALFAIHPLGKSPVIDDEGLRVAESGAIIDYLLSRYGSGRLMPPAESSDWLSYRYFLHYAEGSAMPLLVMSLVFSRLGQKPVPWLLRPFGHLLGQGVSQGWLVPQIRRHLSFLEDSLPDEGWFAGAALTAADIQLSFVLEAARARGFLVAGRYPRLTEFVERCQARDAYRRALATGGPYDFAS